MDSAGSDDVAPLIGSRSPTPLPSASDDTRPANRCTNSSSIVDFANEDERGRECRVVHTEPEPNTVLPFELTDQAEADPILSTFRNGHSALPRSEEPTTASDDARPHHESHHGPHVGHSLECCAAVTAFIVGYNAFTEYFFNMTSWDAAFHQDWMHNATIFGARCDADTFFDWLRIFVLVELPVMKSNSGLAYGNDSHTALTICCLSGWLVAALLAFILSLTPMRKRVLGLFHASSLAITLSGVLLGVAWFGDYSSSSFISQCLFSMLAKFFSGFGVSAAWCFGVPLLYGYTRPEVHTHAEHLLGSLAIAIVSGELLGFLTASFAREGSWIMITASFTATAFLPSLIPQVRKQLREYAFPSGLGDAGPANTLEFLATKRFYLNTIRAGVLWSTVDITRSAFRIGFGDFLEAIDEPEEHATIYAVLADVLSMFVCSVSIVFGCALPRINRPLTNWLNNDHRWPFGKLIAVSIGAFTSLLSIVGFDAAPSKTVHSDVGWPYVGYIMCSAIAFETLLEYVPELFDKHSFLTGWTLTVLFRIGMQLVVNTALSLFIHTLHWKLWSVFIFQTALKVCFIGVAWGLRNSGGQHGHHGHHLMQNDDDVNHSPSTAEGAGRDRDHAA